jgi:hypothetical protein
MFVVFIRLPVFGMVCRSLAKLPANQRFFSLVMLWPELDPNLLRGSRIFHFHRGKPDPDFGRRFGLDSNSHARSLALPTLRDREAGKFRRMERSAAATQSNAPEAKAEE